MNKKKIATNKITRHYALHKELHKKVTIGLILNIRNLNDSVTDKELEDHIQHARKIIAAHSDILKTADTIGLGEGHKEKLKTVTNGFSGCTYSPEAFMYFQYLHTLTIEKRAKSQYAFEPDNPYTLITVIKKTN